MIFDGVGSYTLTGKSSETGINADVPLSYSGTYLVNTDGSFTFDTPDPSTITGGIKSTKDVFVAANVSEQNEQGIWFGISAGTGLSNIDLSGTYYMVDYNTNTNGTDTSISKLVFDGTGNFSGEQTFADVNAPNQKQNFTGTYSVSDNGWVLFDVYGEVTNGLLSADGQTFIAARINALDVQGISFGVKVTSSYNPNIDSDGDGLPDYIEILAGTDPYNADTDNDGLVDGNAGSEDLNADDIVDPGETDPLNPDTDGDGIFDGTERGLTAPETSDTDLAAVYFVPDADPSTTTDPTDADSDDDGIPDGVEDANRNGQVDPGETSPINVDSDGDGIQDGTELGYTLADVSSDTDISVFVPDSDPSTTTDPINSDSDGDGITDGDEDPNHNGSVDAGESDPNVIDELSFDVTKLSYPGISGAWIVDADNDGENDVVVLQDYNLKVLDTSLVEKATVSFNERTKSLSWGDVDSDGQIELVVGTGNGDSGGYIYVGEIINGSWNQEGKSGAIGSIRFPEEIEVADFDSDGDLEIALGVTWYGRYLVTFEYENGVFTESWRQNIGSDVNYVDSGDLDGDGQIELAVGTSCWSDFQARVYKNGSLFFNTGYGGSTHVSIGDIDGDGIDELVVSTGSRCGGSSSVPDQSFSVYKHDGTGMQNIYTSTATPGYASYMLTRVADIDADGIDEIIVAKRNNSANVWNVEDFSIYKQINGSITQLFTGDVYPNEVLMTIQAGVLDGQNIFLLSTDKTVRIFGYNLVVNDTDGDGIIDAIETAGNTDPFDADTDDDGILDGFEDKNANGIVDDDETDPTNVDTDQDGIQDGTESGVTLNDIGTDTDTTVFVPDADPSTTTSPLNFDSDGDGIADGLEDPNYNGRVDVGETDPSTFTDVIAPVVTPPAAIVDYEATGPLTDVSIGMATATDVVGVVSLASDAPASYPVGTTTVTWTATDAAGNVGTATQAVTVVDTTPPVISGVEDILNREATAVLSPVGLDNITAYDLVDGDVTPQLMHNAPAGFGLGATPVTWSVADSRNNTSTAIQQVQVVDTTVPIISCPGDMVYEANLVYTTLDTGFTTATDIFLPVDVVCDAPLGYQVGTTIVTCNATDPNGNSSTCSYAVTVVDTTPPVVTPLADIVDYEATGPLTEVNIGTATATDMVGVVSLANNAPASYPVGTTTVTWTATDTAGNVGAATQLVTVVDTTDPVITCPADIIDHEATSSQSPVDIGMATATDMFSVTVTSDEPLAYPVGIKPVTWTATDANGNISTCVQTVEVVDRTPPVISGVLDMFNYEATAVCSSIDLGNVMAFDLVDLDVTGSLSRAPLLDCYNLGSTTLTWSVVDSRKNTSTATQQVLVVDTTDPVITCPVNIGGHEATGSGTPVDIGTATATDIFPVAIESDAPLDYPVGTTSVTWAATDSNGNSSTCVQIIEVVDTTPPVVTPPADIVDYEATGPLSPVSIGMATATDAVGVVSLTSDAPASYPVGTTTVIWTAKDAAGNVGTATQTVTVVDTTPPVISGVLDIMNYEATAVLSPVNLSNVTAYDLVDGDVTAQLTNNAPAGFGLGSTTVTWTVADSRNNASTANQNVLVVDTTSPVISCPANVLNYEATGSQTQVSIGEASATDIFTPVAVNSDAPLDYSVGTTTINWTATDPNGNSSTCSQSINVVDTTAPVVTPPANIVGYEATGPLTDVSIDMATATDAVGVVSLTNDASASYPVGTTTVTWTAKDEAGNVSTATQTVTVVDTTPPMINGVKDILDYEATAVCSLVNLGDITAYDLVDLDVTGSLNRAPLLDCYNLGSTTLTWSVADSRENTSTASQQVLVVDTTDPVITCPANIVNYEATGSRTLVDIGMATATDIFIPVTVNSDAPLDYSVGTTTVNWTATDPNGNSSTCSQSINVVDTTAPVVTPPAAIVDYEATGPLTDVNIGTATVTDVVGVVSLISDAPASYLVGTTTVTWTARDAAGNVGTATQTVTVVDTTPPVINGIKDILDYEATAVCSPVNLGDITAYDLVDLDVTNSLNRTPVLDCYNLGTTTLTWSVVDSHNNPSSESQQVLVVDTTDPVLTVPQDITVYAQGVLTQIDIGMATATDIFEPVIIENNAPDAFEVGPTPVTWTATDPNGNSISAIQNIVVEQRLVSITNNGDTKVDWSDYAELGVHVQDVTGDHTTSVIENAGAVTYRILGYSMESLHVNVDSNGNVSFSHFFNDPNLPAGPYIVRFSFNDPTGVFASNSMDLNFNVYPEKGTVEYTGDQVVTTYDDFIYLQATMYQEENEVNGELINFDTGLNNTWVQFHIYKFTQTPMPGGEGAYYSTAHVLLQNSQLHPGVAVAGINVPLATIGTMEANYVVVVEMVNNNFINAPADEATATVYDPDGRFFTGGGYIVDPMSSDKNNFGFTFKFNKNGKAQGNVIYMIRDRVEGIKIRVKSNMLEAAGFPVGDPPDTPTAIAKGKCNLAIYDLYTDEYLSGQGNLVFHIFVEDMGKKGVDEDTFKLELRYPDGVPYEPYHMVDKEYIDGGNIVIHNITNIQ
jgi:4-hydroxy-3-methylbut-2-enyl diphosphate reductase IspH